MAWRSTTGQHYSQFMIVKDHWRITTTAIQLEMERIAGLLEKSLQFQSRTSAPHSLQQRHVARSAAPATPELAVENLVRK